MNKQKELLTYACLLEEDGFLNALEGNISIIDRASQRTYITPSGKRKQFLTAEQVAVMDEHGAQIGGSLPRSSEYLLHEQAYRARPDIGACIHSHCKHLTAFALRGKLIAFDTSVFMANLVIPCIPCGMPGTREIAQGLDEALQHSDAVLLANHGVLCVGADMERCAALIETLESQVQTCLLAASFGDAQPVPADIQARLREKYGH